MGIESQGELDDGHAEFGTRQVEVGGHAQGMNTRIGAAGTMNARPAGKQLSQRFLQDLLDSQADGLDLPALVGRPVVGDTQLNTDAIHEVHCRGSAPASQPETEAAQESFFLAWSGTLTLVAPTSLISVVVVRSISRSLPLKLTVPL